MKTQVDDGRTELDLPDWDGGDHPPVDLRTLFAVDPDRLPAEVRGRVAAHLDSCPRCLRQHEQVVESGLGISTD